MIGCVLVILIYKCHMKKIFSEVKSRQDYTNGKYLVDSHFSIGVIGFALNFNAFSFASIFQPYDSLTDSVDRSSKISYLYGHKFGLPS